MQQKKVSPLATIAVFSLYLISMGITVITPAMNAIITAWADTVPITTIYMVSTLPTLIMVPFTILAGSVAGKKVKYRTLAIAGTVCFLIGGCAPALIHGSFTVILAFRALFGVGLGLISPLGNALVLGLYEPKTASSYLGYGTLLGNVGGIIFQQLGGIFANISWELTFWGHALGIVAVILVFFLPEPELPAAPAGSENAPKEKMSSFIWFTAIVFFLLNLANYPLMMNMSVLFEAKSAGGATAAATALSIFTVAGCVAGAIFGKLFGTLKRFTIPTGLIICAVGHLVILKGTTAVIMSCGTALLGFGFSLVMPAMFAYIGMKTAPSTIALATSINVGLMNVSGFVASYYLVALGGVFGEYLYSSYYCAMAIFIVLAIVFCIYNPTKAPETE